MARKTPLKAWMDALKQRLNAVLVVIDDALNSEHLKDRIWAVDQVLKRLKPEAFFNPDSGKTQAEHKKTELQFSQRLRTMSDTELHTAIAELLADSADYVQKSKT